MEVKEVIGGIFLLILGILLIILPNLDRRKSRAVLLKVARFLGPCLALSAGFFALYWIGVQIDLVLNPFVRNIQPHWRYLFTSHHGPAIAWLHLRTVYFIFTGTVSVLLGAIISWALR